MPKYQRFEDLPVWREAARLYNRVLDLLEEPGVPLSTGFRHQLDRAALSVSNNIAEGFERSRPKEFHQFLSISTCSCGELRSQLYIALDAAHIDEGIFCHHLALAEETSRIINGLRASVKRSLR